MRRCQPDPAHWMAQYEALRAEAIESIYGGHRGHGLTLFLTRGMTAWIEALSALAPKPATSSEGPALGRVPPSARLDLTSLLADMVLACSSQEAA